VADNGKSMALVDAILSSARKWAEENVQQRYTGTMNVEIDFFEGGVRTPTITEKRVLVVRKLPG